MEIIPGKTVLSISGKTGEVYKGKLDIINRAMQVPTDEIRSPVTLLKDLVHRQTREGM